MGTRGCIAREGATPGTFSGRYHHWDSYPSGLGKALFEMIRARFKQDPGAACVALIDEAPAGWSTILDNSPTSLGVCYPKSDPAWEVTEQNAAGSGVEWTYAIDAKARTMRVLRSVRRENGKPMIGYFGMGDEKSDWRTVALVPLDGATPDWNALDEWTPAMEAGQKAK